MIMSMISNHEKNEFETLMGFKYSSVKSYVLNVGYVDFSCHRARLELSIFSHPKLCKRPQFFASSGCFLASLYF